MTKRSIARASRRPCPPPQERVAGASLAGLGSQPPVVRDWLTVQQNLLQAERDLAAAVERHARGEASSQELDEASERAIALRELSLAVLQRLRGS